MTAQLFNFRTQRRMMWGSGGYGLVVISRAVSRRIGRPLASSSRRMAVMSGRSTHAETAPEAVEQQEPAIDTCHHYLDHG